MSGAVAGSDLTVVPGNLGGVAHQQGDGGACSAALEDAGEDFHLVRLAAGGGDFALTGFAPVQIALDIPLLQSQSCGTAVDDYSQSRSMGLSPGGDSK